MSKLPAICSLSNFVFITLLLYLCFLPFFVIEKYYLKKISTHALRIIHANLHFHSSWMNFFFHAIHPLRYRPLSGIKKFYALNPNFHFTKSKQSTTIHRLLNIIFMSATRKKCNFCTMFVFIHSYWLYWLLYIHRWKINKKYSSLNFFFFCEFVDNG